MNGIEARFILPDLQSMILVYGSNSAAARELGMSEWWVRAVLKGRIRVISFPTAHKLAEAKRGKRDTDENWRDRRDRERKRDYETRQRRKNPGRFKVTHEDHVCKHCGGKLDTAHALWMHSGQIHGDRTQGRNNWMSNRHKP